MPCSKYGHFHTRAYELRPHTVVVLPKIIRRVNRIFHAIICHKFFDDLSLKWEIELQIKFPPLTPFYYNINTIQDAVPGVLRVPCDVVARVSYFGSRSRLHVCCRYAVVKVRVGLFA
jgi:hypothetical protein